MVGAGWAGLAAAIELVAAGHRVTVLEAAPACGGRARGIASGWQGRLTATGRPAVTEAAALKPAALKTAPLKQTALGPAALEPAVPGSAVLESATEDPAETERAVTAPATTGPARLDSVDAPLALDNGQHLVIGAYSTLLGLLARIGIDEGAVFERLPFRLDDGAGLVIAGPGLGGLLRAKGLSWPLRLALLRVLAGIAIARERALATARGKSVAAWSRDSGHPPALLETLWQPLVISTMNTPTDQACAETFVRVLADSLAGGRGASDFLIPHGTLSTAFVDPAVAWLRGHGAVVRNGCDIRAIARDERGYRLVTRATANKTPTAVAGDDCLSGFDGIVLATPPGNAARILRGHADQASMGRTCPEPDGDQATRELSALLLGLEAFDYRPITTVYLGWVDGTAEANGEDAAGHGREAIADADADAGDQADRWQRLPVATLLHDDPQHLRFGQWLFRRPDRAGWRIGAVVISDSAAAMERPREALAQDVSRQLCDALALPPADVYAVFHEKRATIAAVHDRPRLAADVPGCAGIVLAGDYRYHAYPATLEAALRSGRDAAAELDRTLRDCATPGSGASG